MFKFFLNLDIWIAEHVAFMKQNAQELGGKFVFVVYNIQFMLEIICF